MRVYSLIRTGGGTRIVKGTVGIAVLSTVVFVIGANRMGAQVGEQKKAWMNQKEEARTAAAWVSDWEGVHSPELDVWREIGVFYDATISREDARLTFAEELNRLGAECGIDEISLSEVGGGDDEDRLRERGGGTLWSDGGDEIRAAVAEETVPYRYIISFPASYGSFVRFLDRIERMARPVDMHSVSIRRDRSILRVEMELSTYGRTP